MDKGAIAWNCCCENYLCYTFYTGQREYITRGITMEITTISYNRCDMVKAIGRIDSETAPDLNTAFNSIIESGKSGIVFDMSEVDFISSRGIWVLLETQKICSKKKGKLILVNVADEMLKSFDLVGVKHFIEIYNDVTAAVGSF